MKFWSNSDTPAAGTFIPERRLLAAVLQRAVTDYVSGDGDLKDGARDWLFDEEDAECPLTFKFVCEALDLELVGLRKAILVQAENFASSSKAARKEMMLM
jgi:hypothetical protein